MRGPNCENQFDLKPFKNVKVSAVDRITKLFHPKRNPSHDYVLLKRLGHHGLVRRDYIKTIFPPS